ncbi:MAG: MmoB/DmpM family protein [Solirubrobacterales bacterium]
MLSQGEWDGASGYVQDVVDAHLESNDVADPEIYMCGPSGMIEAAEEMLTNTRGVSDQRVFHDKFPTSADAGGEGGPAASEGPTPPTKRVDDASARAADEEERHFGWYQPRRRRATVYEDVTVDTQPSVHRHLRRGWPLRFEDGRGVWWDESTALRSSDWFAFRDPGEQWERTFYQRGTAREQTIEGAVHSAVEEGVLADFSPEWVEFLRSYLQVPAWVEHGLWFPLATAGRDCLSDSLSTAVCLQAAMKQRSLEAAVALAPIAERLPRGIDVVQAVDRSRRDTADLLGVSGITELADVVGESEARPSEDEVAPRTAPKAPATNGAAKKEAPAPDAAAPEVPAGASGDEGDGTYDFVGIVMAKSAEGDAVASILGARDDVEVIEQPAFWDIRAQDRLVIPYEEVGEELGYEIDAYSIQHEMSTHYGRMIAGDEALMLFSDPLEAMEHMMA